MFAVVTTAACLTPTSLSPVTCDASALRGVLARVPLPQHGLELVVADSRIPGAGRGRPGHAELLRLGHRKQLPAQGR